MPFSALVGNDRIKNLLRRMVADDRIGQGLLFAGPRGVGKYRFAIALAQALNCQRPQGGEACGECLACRKIAAAEHPDVQTLSPDGQFIKVDQVRALNEAAQYRPFEGRKRVQIIDEADRLRLEAANSILKTLEEPPESTAIVLVTSKPYALIETIRSRCQMLSFAPLARNELESYLTTATQRNDDDISLRARLARGSIGSALEIDIAGYRQMRAAMIELLDVYSTSGDLVRLLGAAEYLGRKLEREEFEAHLDVLTILLQDVVYLKVGEAGDLLTNLDVAPRLERIAESLSFDRIAQLNEGIETTLFNLIRNVNRQLAMEAVLIG